MNHTPVFFTGSAVCSVVFAAVTVLQEPAHESEVIRLPGAWSTIRADRYDSLQAAVDSLPIEGGKILLPAGTFEITEPVVITRDDVLIQGSGTASHIKNISTEGTPALILRPPSDRPDSDELQWRVTLADFRVSGNEHSGHGIMATDVNELYINGVTVTGNGGDGIHLDHAYEDPRVCNSLVTYNKGTGLYLTRCHDIVVSANQFEENQDAVKCLDSFNLCMTGNNLDDHLGDGVVIEYTYGSVLSGNMIEECQGTAVVLDRDCYGITVSANVVAHNAGGGVDLRDAHGCSVSGNTFTLVKKDALHIGPLSGRITVTGNNFSNSFLGAQGKRHYKNQEPASGLVLEGTSSVTVSGNVFAGLTTPAVTVKRPSRHVLFADNVIEDAGKEPVSRASLSGIVTDNLEVPPPARHRSAPGSTALIE
ncbi:MAG: right-handed parallel beta-helix repeat-containing protein [Fuerstiella sp.]|nr:right-handed parallel beta-helix repeat-containing protein [Fuerstiella sp.]